MDRIRPATGIAVVNRLRRVAMAIRFNLWPIRVGAAPPQSLQYLSRVAVAIHCSVAVSFIFRVQRQGSTSTHDNTRRECSERELAHSQPVVGRRVATPCWIRGFGSGPEVS